MYSGVASVPDYIHIHIHMYMYMYMYSTLYVSNVLTFRQTSTLKKHSQVEEAK